MLKEHDHHHASSAYLIIMHHDHHHSSFIITIVCVHMVVCVHLVVCVHMVVTVWVRVWVCVCISVHACVHIQDMSFWRLILPGVDKESTARTTRHGDLCAASATTHDVASQASACVCDANRTRRTPCEVKGPCGGWQASC